MNIFYLTTIIIGVAVQNIIKRPYTNRTNGKGVYFFSAATSLVAMLFFLIGAKNLSWNIVVLPYSLAFAIAYAVGTVASVVAVGCGSISFTSLIMQYSLMLPTFYGLFFLKDQVSPGFIPGILLLIVSLFLINGKGEDAKFSIKWIISIVLAFVGNGMCSVVQKMQQVRFDGLYKNEFMIAALAIVTVVLTLFITSKERTQFKFFVKSGWHLAIGCGIMNGLVNLFVMILSGRMPVSVMFPLVSAGGIIVTYFVSRLAYKETLSKLQFVGFVLGIASVVFLNI